MSPQSNDGSVLEDDVHLVYSLLLGAEGKPQHVQKRAQVRGRSGALYEVDVYYKFQRAGVDHAVAIECKDHGRPITQGHVNEFWGKISDIGNILGIIVSRRGFQAGATTVASAHGIRCLAASELPSIESVITDWVHHLFLPTSDDIGEPFWAILDISQPTPTYHSLPQHGPQWGAQIPLYISKRLAQQAARTMELTEAWEVRGINQQALMALLPFVARHNGRFVCFFVPPQNDPNGWIGFAKSPEEITEEFVVNHQELVLEFIRRGRALRTP